jgi:hypothetical protein
MHSSAADKAKSSRRLLFWIVIGIIVLNILLFLKFGLTQNSSRAPGRMPSGEAPVTNVDHETEAPQGRSH